MTTNKCFLLSAALFLTFAFILLGSVLTVNSPAQHKKRQSISKKRGQTTATKRPLINAGVGFVTTPPATVSEMLRVAEIKEGDVLYDLGSGDGRIPIEAAKTYGIRAVGVEIEEDLIKKANQSALEAGVADKVSFLREDFFRLDLREATVVTLYLSDKINERLRPKLLRELRPGTRIVSHDFRMGDWKPEKTVRVPWEAGLYRTVYLWRVPARRTIKRK